MAAADGSYSLTGLPASQQPGAQLLAVVSVSGGTPYTLRTSVVRPAVISPTTTLLEAGISHGLSRAEAEAASARQLQVGAALLYRNYLATPGTPSEDSAMRLNDWAIITNLRDGVPLVVGGGSASSGDLVASRLLFTTALSYDVRFYQRGATFDAATGTTELYVLPAGLINGEPRSASMSAPPMWGHGPRGWVPNMVEANVNHVSSGNPYVVQWASGARNSVSETEFNVAGQTLASVVQRLQNPSLYSQPSITGINPANVPGTMPTGARVRHTKWKVTYSDVYLQTSRIPGVSSLDALTATYARSTAPGSGNTISLGIAPGAPSCTGGSICTGFNLRVAFDAATQGLTYYRCDSDVAFTTVSNCVVMASGSFTVGTSNDGVTPLMRLTNSPSVTASGFVQHNGGVYPVTRSAASQGAGSTLRMNREAYNALAAALGITPAPASAPRSAYMGAWRASYSGAESGICTWVLVDALGRLSGQCSSNVRSFLLVGSVSGAGTFASTWPDDVFGGTFLATTASGVWTQPASGTGGTWSATKY